MSDQNDIILSPDCLVLKIEVINLTHNIIYIVYDSNNETFLIRGGRKNNNENDMSYSYETNSEFDLINFIQIVVGDNTINELFYNYNNLPTESSDITFDFLNDNEAPKDLICKYINKSQYKNNGLKILRNVFNYY